MIIMNQISV